ncbi:MAG: hypothetical protein Q9222_001995 [Ikaeria aurantiellina]
MIDETVYTDETSRFYIDLKFQGGSWLRVAGTHGQQWWLQSLSHANMLGFGKLNFEKLKWLVIDIEAPDISDPGQIVCLHQKCADLATLLKQAKQGLPRMRIRLLDSRSAKWNVDGRSKRTFSIHRRRHYPRLKRAHRPYSPMTLDLHDSETYSLKEDNHEIKVLIAFLSLRNVRSVKIKKTEGLQYEDDSLKTSEMTLEQEEPFRTVRKHKDPWVDAHDQESMDKVFLALDLDLDLLPGPTANMMRLERFISWYADEIGSTSRYEKLYERIAKHKRRWGIISSSMMTRRLWSLYMRYALMRALNPASSKHRLSLPSSFRYKQSSTGLNLEPQPPDEKWDRDAWRRAWPDGIPPFDSEECSLAKAQGLDGIVSKDYEDAFEDKIVSWVSVDNWVDVNSMIYYMRRTSQWSTEDDW